MSSIKDIAIEAAKQGGAILKEAFDKQVNVEVKATHDVVTQVDKDSEQVILPVIQNNFPDHTIQAEESGNNEKQSEYTWYVDPLDGTSSFIMGSPYFSVSIAVAKRSEVICGVVYNPILDELFVAEKGQGATRNGKKIHVSSVDTLADALLECSYNKDEGDDQNRVNDLRALVSVSRRILVNFSPALDLCNIARGRMEGMVGAETTPEDHAAGALIVMEAGGAVTNYDGSPFTVDTLGLIASNGHFHKQILNCIS